jgi:hypothetical protein
MTKYQKKAITCTLVATNVAILAFGSIRNYQNAEVTVKSIDGANTREIVMKSSKNSYSNGVLIGSISSILTGVLAGVYTIKTSKNKEL